MILLIDNYDSFTFNLYQYLRLLGQEVEVARNDLISLEQIEQKAPKAIVLSPGPGSPQEAGICLPLIERFYREVPILGICLGHQSIGEHFGLNLIRSPQIVHGKVDKIYHEGHPLFEKMDNPFQATRYHSLLLTPSEKECELDIICTLQTGEIMGITHKKYPVFGVQFHPESFGTKEGMKILNNFVHRYMK